LGRLPVRLLQNQGVITVELTGPVVDELLEVVGGAVVAGLVDASFATVILAINKVFWETCTV